MTDTQAQEAARLAIASDALADEREMIHLCSWVEIRNLLRADAALLRSQAARIAELEQELARMREPLSDGVDESGAPRPGYLIRRINVGNLKAIYRNGSATPMLAALGNCINAIEDAQTVLGITKTGGGV